MLLVNWRLPKLTKNLTGTLLTTNPSSTQRHNDVVTTSSQRHYNVNDVVTTSSQRFVLLGNEWTGEDHCTDLGKSHSCSVMVWEGLVSVKEAFCQPARAHYHSMDILYLPKRILHQPKSRHRYDSFFLFDSSQSQKVWFNSTHYSQWLNKNWFKSVHASKSISEVWFRSTHDSKCFWNILIQIN